MDHSNAAINNLLLVGLNHRTAPVELREKLASHPEDLRSALKKILAAEQSALESTSPEVIGEFVLLSTCNRIEVYTCSSRPDRWRSEILAQLSKQAQISTERLEQSSYIYQGENAAHHLLRVAAGLDSLVVGEHEILGQVKQAYETAFETRTAGASLSALFRAGLQAGKRVHTETEIGRAGLSIASVVVELAQEMLGSLEHRTALLIGAGKISSLTARALTGAGLHCILVANRTFERALNLAASLGGQAVHFEKLPASLIEADIVICSTGAPHIVLHAETVRQAMSIRSNRELLVADLAVPRNADPLIAGLEGVHLKNIDDLDELVRARHPLAAAVRKQAETIVCEELECLQAWLESRRNAALICALNNRLNEIVQSQLDKTSHHLGDLTAEQCQALEKMGQAIVKQILHEPIQRLKSTSEEEALQAEYAIRALFDLKP